MTTRDAVKAALYTALWAFLALFGLSLVGWLQGVVDWASDTGADFPDLSVVGRAAVSAVAAAASGFVGFVVRFAQSKGAPGDGPHYPTPGA